MRVVIGWTLIGVPTLLLVVGCCWVFIKEEMEARGDTLKDVVKGMCMSVLVIGLAISYFILAVWLIEPNALSF